MVAVRDLTGQTFGRFVVVSRHPISNPEGKARFNVKCSCGNERIVVGTVLTRKNPKTAPKSCGCYNIEQLKLRKGTKYTSIKGNKHPNWVGYGEIPGYYWNRIETGAGLRGKCNRSKKFENMVFDIDLPYVWELFLEQDRKCAFTGTLLSFDASPEKTIKYGKRDITASLDRIDSSIGYIKGNVQWIHKDVNRMKGTMSDETFIQLCRKVTEHRNNG